MVLLAALADADHALAQEDTGEAEAPVATARLNVEWITALTTVDPAETTLNPDNRTFRIPQVVAITEVRPNLRLEVGSRWQFVVRPRWRGALERASADGLANDDIATGKATMTEAYVNWRPADTVSVAYGLQNFQWGPAELVSPSNRIFHEIGIFRDPLYYVRGKHLARVNVSAGRQWSLVTLAEIGATDEPAFRAGESFGPKAQAKLEYTTASGASYGAATLGARAEGGPWFGGYGSLAVTEGLSLYADASVERGSEAWYPEPDPGGGAIFARTAADSRDVHVFANAGVRYTFVNGVDARLEYVHQGAGYADAQMDLAALAVATEASRTAVERWTAPGLEFLGRRLALVSVRVPDRLPGDRLDLHGRYLRSFTDDSGVFFATTTYDAAAALVVFGSVTLSHGAAFAEFSRLVRAAAVGGIVWSW